MLGLSGLKVALRLLDTLLVNGSPQGFFASNNGLRQGDPLSPFLFVIMVEVLGCNISKARGDGRWKGIGVARGEELVSHQQFSNDTLLLGESSPREARVMKYLLENYCLTLGQQVNWNKYEITFFNTSLDR